MRYLITSTFAAFFLMSPGVQANPKLMLKPTVMQSTAQEEDVYVAQNLEAIIKESAGKDYIVLGAKGHDSYKFQTKSALRYKLISEKLMSVAKLKDVMFVITTSSNPAYSYPPMNMVALSARYIDNIPTDSLSFILGHELGHIVMERQRREQDEDLAHSISRAILKEAGWFHPCLQAKTDLRLFRLKALGFHNRYMESEASGEYQACMATQANEKQGAKNTIYSGQ